jgi:hypothetical protein
VVLKDVFRDGRVLLVRENLRRELSGIVQGEAKLRDFSWFEWTNVTDIPRDGKTFAFYEAGIGGGKDFSLFLRKTDGSPVLRGSGYNASFSPDGKWVLANSAHPPAQLFLYPISAGETSQLTRDQIDHMGFGWLPDNKQRGIHRRLRRFAGACLRGRLDREWKCALDFIPIGLRFAPSASPEPDLLEFLIREITFHFEAAPRGL